MRFRLAIVAALAALGAVVPTAQAGQARLARFGSCGALVGYAKLQAIPFVTASGLGVSTPVTQATPGAPGANSAAIAQGAAPLQQGVDYSGTNVQETGVDEPDIVKTDGNTLFAAENGQLESVDVSGSTPKLLDTMQLSSGSSNELLLFGTHLLVLSRGGGFVEPLPARPAAMYMPVENSTILTEVDVSDPSNLKVIQTASIDGGYLDARMIGSTVRIVNSSGLPIALPFVAGSRAHNASVVAHSTVKQWLPTYKLGRHAPRPLVQCRNVRYPIGFSGLGMLTVTTIDLSQGLSIVNSTGLMTDGSIVYASPTTLYVATEQWGYRPLPAEPQQAIPGAQTEISAFDISNPTTTTYLGSGSVPGYLLSQWSLSEFQGVLRVVSTDSPAWWGLGPATRTFLTTLEPQNGQLAQVGQLGGLGQGERVYAVRFIGLDAFVVTYQQVDPLHAIDVSNPAAPKLAGTLEISGYSSYLQPINGKLLLGVGQLVGSNNEPSGAQVSLFDISDLSNPKLIQQYPLGSGSTGVESDTHAFLYWPQTNLVVLPFGQEAVGLTVTTSSISELGRIVQTDSKSSALPQIDRAVVDRSTLLTVSSAGVKSNNLSTFAAIGWTAFPQQPQPLPDPIHPGSPTPINPGGPMLGAAATASSSKKK